MNKKAFITLFVLLITSFTFAQNKIISVDAKANISLLNGSISEYGEIVNCCGLKFESA